MSVAFIGRRQPLQLVYDDRTLIGIHCHASELCAILLLPPVQEDLGDSAAIGAAYLQDICVHPGIVSLCCSESAPRELCTACSALTMCVYMHLVIIIDHVVLYAISICRLHVSFSLPTLWIPRVCIRIYIITVQWFPMRFLHAARFSPYLTGAPAVLFSTLYYISYQ